MGIFPSHQSLCRRQAHLVWAASVTSSTEEAAKMRTSVAQLNQVRIYAAENILYFKILSLQRVQQNENDLLFLPCFS